MEIFNILLVMKIIQKPKEVYGGTKYAGEVIVEAFSRRFGIEYSIVRPSAVYGPTDVNREHHKFL